MNAIVNEADRLLDLAWRDARACKLLIVHAPAEDFALAAFHAQQAVEKAIKSVLCRRGVLYRRTHDLLELAACALESGGFLPLIDVLQRLTPYGVEYRYNDPGMVLIDPEAALRAVDDCIAWAESHRGASS